jgi:hypothetical protein
MKFSPVDPQSRRQPAALRLRQILQPWIKPLILRHFACCLRRRQQPNAKRDL